MGAVTVNGGLPPEVVQRIVRQNYGRFRLCYEDGLGRNPNLEGKVSVRFRIQTDGSPAGVANAGSDLPDSSVVSCIMRAFVGLAFPAPEGGVVTVTYPINFAPGGGAGAPPAEPAVRRAVVVRIGDMPRVAQRCSAAAGVPLDQRVQLWRERLAKVSGSPSSVALIYSNALALCEAPTARERRLLLSLLLDALPKIADRVALRRLLVDELGAADQVYRMIIARVRTPEQRRDYNRALGLKAMDTGALAKLLKSVRAAAERAAKLRPLHVEWPDDFSVALALLDSLEDSGDGAACRELAGRLLARPDADARVRTAVGELYLRLASRAASAGEKEWLEAAARRAFGEIVEFAPDDPIARRRLGDLFRAHGWYPEARRQYETLGRLVPDDTSVPVLIALTAERQGRLEEAVRWIEKTSPPGAADLAQGPPGAGRAIATTFLAWGRQAARAAGRKAEIEALTARAQPLVAVSSTGRTVRVSLTWAHPEFHPRLWSNALGSAMPAPGGDALLGIAEVLLPDRPDAAIEVRLEADDLEHAARLGQSARLTAVFDELTPREKVVELDVRFVREGPKAQRFLVRGGEVVRE
jgi:Ca-activated chloride channel family protein